MYRNTYLEINLRNIENNVKQIIDNYSEYKYYFGVVKADGYGHGDIQIAKTIIKRGCNYLCVATLDEAMEIRKEIKEVPILCLGVINSNYMDICIRENITVTIPSLEYIKELEKINLEDLKVHLKINTGMNRLGIKKKDELKQVYEILKSKKADIEGIYTHIYEASNRERYEKQVKDFKEITKVIPIEEIKIIHISASEAIVNYNKPKNINGCRLGIIMYGFTNKNELKLESTFKLKSEIIQINDLEPGETIGYNAIYMAKEKERIAVIPIRVCRWNY